jgi:ribosomal RNA-processing protein 8
MREKLISARFRHLNETLYTRPSAEAFQLFQDSPEMFTEYHEGFRRQVDVWPENPVDGFIADIKARSKVRFPPRNRDNSTPLAASQLPLPNPPGTKSCSIADLGCGDAKLATALQSFKSKLHLDIRSFDLQTGNSPLVTRADIANLPLAANSVDVAIFCLALMGTNWIDFVEEAYRILRWRGELWVAEIKSRFTNPEATKKVVAHSVGNRKKGAAAAAAHGAGKKSAAKAAQAAAEEESNLADLAVHVDGAEARRQQETDIGAFLEALRKRGFLLNRDLGDAAVDMGNKMFVRMHFVKAAPAVKGKCATAGAVDRAAGEKKWTDGKGKVVQKKKFLGGGEEEADDAVNEAAVLKPCVYKIR